MTITLPDGREVTEIVLPDGSTATQVIAPDGSVVFDAGAAIPDSGALHARYDFSEYSGTSGFNDLTGNGRDLVNGSITGVGESINGVQAGNFDGDGVYTDSFSDIYPFTVSVVVRVKSLSSSNQVVSQHSPNNMLLWFNGSVWELNAALNITSSNSDSGVLLLTAVFADTGALFRLNGTQIASGSTGTGRAASLHSIGSGETSFSGNYLDGAVGEMLVYPDVRSSQQIGDIESYLADKWGITL